MTRMGDIVQRHRTGRTDPVLAVLVTLTAAAAPVFALSGARAVLLVPLYWTLLLVFQTAFAVSAARVSRLYRAGEDEEQARAGRRFWRYCAFAFAIMAAGDLIQVARAIHGPLDRAAYMGTELLLITVVVGTLLLAVGLLRHPGRSGTPQEQTRLRLDTATVLAGAATFGILVVQLPTGATGVAWVVQFITTILIQPILFLVLIFGVLRLTFGGMSPFTRRAGAVLGSAAVLQAITQAIPEAVYLANGHGNFPAIGAALIGSGLAAIGARIQERQGRTQSAATAGPPERPFSRLPYAAMAATWVLAGGILIHQGLTWRSAAVLVGTMVTTALIVCRQLQAFQHINQLLRERDDLAARLSDLAYHDGLTGLANRTAFTDALARSLSSGVPVTVLLIDLDKFKPVNDTFGHATGDRLLIEVARRLRQQVGSDATVARLGGDEFAVLATGLTAEAGDTLAGHLRRVLSGTVLIDAATVTLSGTVGVATGTGADYNSDGLLHAADMDMYAQKNHAITAVATPTPQP
jgi:diguanylate cyclase (GGDEF)-like protein